MKQPLPELIKELKVALKSEDVWVKYTEIYSEVDTFLPHLLDVLEEAIDVIAYSGFGRADDDVCNVFTKKHGITEGE